MIGDGTPENIKIYLYIYFLYQVPRPYRSGATRRVRSLYRSPGIFPPLFYTIYKFFINFTSIFILNLNKFYTFTIPRPKVEGIVSKNNLLSFFSSRVSPSQRVRVSTLYPRWVKGYPPQSYPTHQIFIYKKIKNIWYIST